MKVLSLSVRDYAGIVEADVIPGKITVFAGKNRQGKTSLVNAIRAALEGADPIEIHKGSARAEILVDLEEIKVRRRITPSGTTVEVTDPKGFTRKAPQTYLSSLLGTVQFNPMEFIRAKRPERRKMLLDAVAQTVTAEQIIEACGEVIPGIPVKGPALLMYDLAWKHYYALRHAKNKELVNRRELARSARAKVPEGYEPVPLLDEKGKAVAIRADVLGKKIATLQAEKKSAERAAQRRVALEDAIRVDTNSAEAFRATANLCVETEATLAEASRRVQAIREQLRQAEADEAAIRGMLQDRDRANAKADEAEARIASAKETLSVFPGAFDEEQLREAEEERDGLDNEAMAIELDKVRQRVLKEAVDAEAARDALQAEADSLDGMVILFRDILPGKTLSEAKLPVEGLRIDGDDITIDGIPIDNRSGAEKMELALSIVRALAADNPLKLICVDGAEQLDEESFAAFEAQAEKDEFQYWVTRVGSPREGEIEVAGGKVVAS